MAVIYVDFTPVIGDITRVLQKAESRAQAEQAVMWGLNQVGDKARTKVRRKLGEQTYVRYARISKDITADRAHPNRLSYKILAKDSAIPLREFLHGTVRAGQKRVPYRAWKNQKTQVLTKHVFIMGPRGGGGGKVRFKRGRAQGDAGRVIGPGLGLGPVKRVSKGHGAGSLRSLWGPIIPHEMLRKDDITFRYIQTVVPVEFVPVLEQKLAAIMAGAGAKKKK